MIAIFNIEQDASDYADKIHVYLEDNRPNYSAIKWSNAASSTANDQWMVKQPIEEEENLWPIPIDSSEELSKADGITEPLPEFGELVTIDLYYLYKGDILKCRQTHNRTIHEPKNTPALFAYFRDNSDQLQWIENEQVEIGWVRIFDDIKYEVIQAHQTQIDWTPDVAVTLWKVWIDPNEIPEIQEWSVGISYVGDNVAGTGNGDEVEYLGDNYRCLQSHTSISTWTPLIASLWVKL